MVSRHWLYFSGFVVTVILLIGAALMGIVEGLSALSGSVPLSEEFILLAILGAAAEWVLVVLILGIVAVAFLAATVVSILRTGSLPRDDRLVSVVELLEQKYPLLRQFDVSEKVEPTAEDRQQQIKEQYVAGEMSEGEFEQKMEQLMDRDSENRSESMGERRDDIGEDSR